MRPDDPFRTGPFEAGDPYGLDPGPGPVAPASAVDADDLVRHDHGRLLWNLALAGAQVRRAAQVAGEWGPDRLDLGGAPRAVVVATDPATAAVADLLAAVGPPVAPVITLDVPDLPRWVGAADAVLVTSLDGGHPRLVAIAEQASRRGASLAVVAPADSPLAAAARGVVVDLPADTAVRAAFWSVLGPVLLVADAWRLTAPAGRRLDDVAAALDETAHRCRPGSDAVANPARALAEDFETSTPVIVGSGPLAAAAARRWASSLRLFAGAPALATGLPGQLAETTAVLTGSGGDPETDLFRDRVEDPVARPRLVLIGDDRDELRLPESEHRPGPGDLAEGEAHAAAGVVRRHAEAAGVPAVALDVPEGHPLVRFAAAAAVGDFTATYLALGRGLDPSAPRPGEVP